MAAFPLRSSAPPRRLALSVGLATALGLLAGCQPAAEPAPAAALNPALDAPAAAGPRSAIFLHPDGMGANTWMATRLMHVGLKAIKFFADIGFVGQQCGFLGDALGREGRNLAGKFIELRDEGIAQHGGLRGSMFLGGRAQRSDGGKMAQQDRHETGAFFLARAVKVIQSGRETKK